MGERCEGTSHRHTCQPALVQFLGFSAKHFGCTGPQLFCKRLRKPVPTFRLFGVVEGFRHVGVVPENNGQSVDSERLNGVVRILFYHRAKEVFGPA